METAAKPLQRLVCQSSLGGDSFQSWVMPVSRSGSVGASELEPISGEGMCGNEGGYDSQGEGGAQLHGWILRRSNCIGDLRV